MGPEDKIGSADTVAFGTTPSDPDLESGQDPLGDVFANRYRIDRLLGRGGMGRVYQASDQELDEVVALKLLASHMASLEAVDLLRQEAKLARRITHKNVARVFDVGEHAGRYFLTMELIEGESLAELLAREGRLSSDRGMPILMAAARGLAAAHEAGVIHRDIKPENILVAASGRVVVTDFGIARAAGSQRDGRVAGTPAYMSPEQVRGGAVDASADVFSLGVTAFRMFTGELPWHGDNNVALAEARLRQDAPDAIASGAEIPESLARILARAMARIPEARFPSARALVEALGGLASTPAAHTPTPTPYTSPCAGPLAHKRSIAVLPIANRGDPGDAHLSDGLTEELIDALCQLNSLRVSSYGIVRRVIEDERPAHEIGAALGVDVVVTGSLQRSGEEVRASLRAISSADGVQLWSRRFAVPTRELLTVSDEVVRGLAGDAPVDIRAPVREGMPTADAMEAYLRARAAYQQVMGTPTSVRLFERALEMAPESPLVLAGFAMALLRQWMMLQADPGGLADRATRMARKAVHLAPHMGEAHLALGYLQLHKGDPVGAVGHYRAAVACAPSLADAHGILGGLLVEMGRLPEARQRLEIAQRLDAALVTPSSESARVAALLGDWKTADEILDRQILRATTPIGWILPARVAAYRRDQARLEAIATGLAQMEPDVYGTHRIATVLVDAYLGRCTAATAWAIMRTADGDASQRRVALGMQLRAELAGFLGDTEQVIESLELGDHAGLVDLFWLDRCPLLLEARTDPRFIEIRDRIQQRAHAAYDAFRS
ncbi:MAG TPA: protein kinase [Kofleriaceae bacterium]|nr:protein kinase [Kofleriaceae bacterium]